MTKSYSLGPNPKWYFVNKNGKPLSGGKVNTYSSLNPSVRKNVFATPSEDFPLVNPFDIDADGTAGPFWFQFDSTNPDDGYLIIVTDALGVEIWSVDHYFANTSGGGSITIALNVDNLIKNNVFWRHTDDILTPVPTYSVIAPSNNANLVSNTTVAGTNPSPDIVFLKDTAVGTDSITFPLFTPLGADPVIDVDDTTPVDYFNYQCLVPDPLQTVRCLQFPISAKVQNLSNKQVVGSFWAIGNSAANQQISLKWFQYFGDGAGASVVAPPTITTFTLTVPDVWTLLTFSTTVPDVSGKTLGAPNNSGPNDGLFLQIQFQDPPTTACDIGITKPTLYLGTALPDLDFQSYDEIDSIISKPRTGDIRIGLNSFAPFGWVACNDGVLAKSSDGTVETPPAGISIARFNYDTYPLYSLLWSIFQANPAFMAIYTNAGVVTTIGASAIADFSAGKQLLLTRQLGRALASAGQASNVNNVTGVVTPFGSTWTDGESTGSETQTLTNANQLPPHTHTIGGGAQNFYATGGAGNFLQGGLTFQTQQLGATDSTGTSQPFTIMQPTAFFNVFLKL